MNKNIGDHQWNHRVQTLHTEVSNGNIHDQIEIQSANNREGHKTNPMNVRSVPENIRETTINNISMHLYSEPYSGSDDQNFSASNLLRPKQI